MDFLCNECTVSHYLLMQLNVRFCASHSNKCRRWVLKFWVLLNCGFHSTASLFKFVSFQSAHKKHHKKLFSIFELFRLKDFANFTTQKADSESTCFSDYANLRHFSNFLADDSVRYFHIKCRTKVDQSGSEQFQSRILNFYPLHWLTRLLQSLMEARDEPACF